MQQKNNIVTYYYNTFKLAKKRVLIDIETTFPNRDSRVVKYTLGNAVFNQKRTTINYITNVSFADNAVSRDNLIKCTLRSFL